MKTKFTFFLCLVSLFIFSQQSNNYFIKKDGEKVFIYKGRKGKKMTYYSHTDSENYALTGEDLCYYNEKGYEKCIKQRKIESALLDNKHFTNLKIGNFLGLKRLHEIIIENEDYILTQYYFNKRLYAYLLDKNKGEFIFKKELISKKKKYDKELFNQKIQQYFKDCPLFIEMVNKNLNGNYEGLGWGGTRTDYNVLFKGISSFKCN
ncbi:hypothetical protein [uncultured Aquimarina sp.]|uniref:hypothetical protein n=1 Tax=uncultured Aquimarina sp. TaxID=575652 RepID=UPI002634D653|nr:hypothetical protein [uncultured Aquimarina sp.]